MNHCRFLSGHAESGFYRRASGEIAAYRPSDPAASANALGQDTGKCRWHDSSGIVHCYRAAIASAIAATKGYSNSLPPWPAGPLIDAKTAAALPR